MKRIALMILTIIFISSSILTAHEKVVTFGAENTPPYAFNDKKTAKGLLPDLVKAAYKDSGFWVRIRILPPKRSSILSEKGKIDGVMGVAKDVSLFEGEVFSDSICKINIHPIVLKETKVIYNSIEDLQQYTLAVVRGVGFEDAFPTLKLDTVTDVGQNITKLFAKRFTIMIEDPVIIDYIVNNSKIYNRYKGRYDVLSPTLIELDLAIGFSSKNPKYQEKLESFNNGLSMIKQNGTYDAIMKRWGIKKTP